MRLLIDRGAKIDDKDKYANTPIIYAARQDNAEMVRMLLDKGADIETTENNDYTGN